jgi:hypothetical protein
MYNVRLLEIGMMNPISNIDENMPIKMNNKHIDLFLA